MKRLLSLNIRSFSTSAPQKTALYPLHLELKGKIVDFAGYALPVQYSQSVIASHNHTRTNASLFDVSHMGQLRFYGSKGSAVKFLEGLTPTDITKLSPYHSKLSVLTNEKGGVIDDCMITKHPDHIYVVVNAGCKEKDIQHFRKQIGLFNKRHSADVRLEYLEDRSLLALQGPKAATALGKVITKWGKGAAQDLSKLPFMSTANIHIKDIGEVDINRCGYTGEDGFEISVSNKDSIPLFKKLISDQDVWPAGLGVRDSLRLDAGLCLYGHELNEDITPVQAGLNFVLDKRRREEGGFLGSDVIQKQLKEGTDTKRVGLIINQGAPARENAIILDKTGKTKIGTVSSGGVSPSTKKFIAMGYVEKEHAKAGTEVTVNVRDKINPATITKLPFVKTSYYKPS